MNELEVMKARAEEAEHQLHKLALSMATLRACAKEMLSQCECRGTGKIRKPRGFFMAQVECTKCIPIREALTTGELV
ncbi:hypothetical protein [Sulfitobacter sp. R18_1]|uniref:hypothetical protein n=1 Tax=Sulfitobacter sp. R18_1 TaxID=2821104 RepID=UPI001AD9FD15|nr:hypothetical protein [Sulfitobacter sp. R18_1]MBO9428024.1 hypothetical protein [Sulfitobacter sp. R18_1]